MLLVVRPLAAISGCNDTKCRKAARLMPRWRSDEGADAEFAAITTEDDDAEFEDGHEAKFDDASGISIRAADTCAARSSMGSRFVSDMAESGIERRQGG